MMILKSIVMSRIIVTLSVLWLSAVFNLAFAQQVCDSSFSRYDLEVDDPDWSHEIFDEPRWRCAVSQTVATTLVTERAQTSFGSFGQALSYCQQQAFSGGFYDPGKLYDLAAKQKDLLEIVNESGENSRACVLIGNGPDATRTLREIGGYSIGVAPRGYVYASGTLHGGEQFDFALLVPLEEAVSGIVSSISLEYVPEIEVSHCFDPLCSPTATSLSQYQHSPIEPELGTVDYSLPIFSSAFPGLVPMSLHYSSHAAISQRDDTYHSSASDRFALNDIKSWHLSYDKKQIHANLGEGTFDFSNDPKQIFILTPNEDRLVFEKQGNSNTWVNVSHPGVTTVVTHLGGGEYEARRPDGYFEQYNVLGRLTLIHYPDGRELTFTEGIDHTGPSPFYRDIVQNYPEATARVYRSIRGYPMVVQSQENPDYRYEFVYDDIGANFPVLQQIIRPDGSTFTIDQRRKSDDTRDGGLLLLDQIRLNSTPIVTIGYDGDNKATSFETLNQEAFSAIYHSDSSSTIESSYGAVYQLSTEAVDVKEADFWGMLKTRNIAQTSCSGCDFSQSSTYQDGLLSSQSRTGILPFSASYDTDGLLDTLTLDGSKQRQYDWDSDNRLLNGVTGTDIVPLTMKYTDNLISSVALNSGGQDSVTYETPRLNGQVTSVSGFGQEKITFNYTSQGFAEGQSNRTNSSYGYTKHNFLGQPETITDPNGLELSIKYDIMGRVENIRRNGVEKMIAQYTPEGQLDVMTLNGDTLTYVYDDDLKVESVTNQDGREFVFDYHSNGLLAGTTDSHGGVSRQVSTDYGPEGEVETVTVPLSTGAQKTDYNRRGQITDYQDGDNDTKYYYDAKHHLETVTHNGENTNYRYDDLGRLKKVSNALIGTDFDYNDLGQTTLESNPNWGNIIYEYDDSQRLDQRQSPERLVDYGYDDSDRIDQITYSDRQGVAETVVANYVYDKDADGSENAAQGRLRETGNGYARNGYRYNQFGNLTRQQIGVNASQEAGSVGFSTEVEYDYDPQDRLTFMRYPSGAEITYDRDPNDGRVRNILRNGQVLATLDYKSQLLPATEWDWGNGISSNREFDDRTRIESMSTQNASDASGTAALFTQSYVYDGKQNLRTLTTGGTLPVGGNQSFDYDSQNRLAQASGSYGTLIYNYDANGNRRLLTENRLRTGNYYHFGTDQLRFTVDANRLLTQFIYDQDGHQTDQYQYQYQGGVLTQLGHRQLEYNGAGRLEAVYEEGEEIARYTYDVNGRRVTKRIGDDLIKFYYDAQGRLLEEVTVDGTLIRQYIYSDENELVAFYSAEVGELLYVHTDYQGAPLFVTDGAQQVVWSAQRRPYGETTVTTQQVELPLRFSNQYYDEETGYHYNEQRYYDPSVGRYLRTDPIGIAGGLNPYSFALNNPLKYVDPDGRYALPSFGSFNFNGVSAEDFAIGGLNSSIDTVAGIIHEASFGYFEFSDRQSSPAFQYGQHLTYIGGVAALVKAGGKFATKGIPDSALVVRGGNEANQAAAKINSAIGPSRTPGVEGFSAQCNGGTCLSTLAGVLKNKQVGVTTAGDIRKAGGDVITTPGFGNHVTVTNLSGEAASPLFKVVKNPNPAK